MESQPVLQNTQNAIDVVFAFLQEHGDNASEFARELSTSAFVPALADCLIKAGFALPVSNAAETPASPAKKETAAGVPEEQEIITSRNGSTLYCMHNDRTFVVKVSTLTGRKDSAQIAAKQFTKVLQLSVQKPTLNKCASAIAVYVDLEQQQRELREAWDKYRDGQELSLDDAFVFAAGYIAAKQRVSTSSGQPQ